MPSESLYQSDGGCLLGITHRSGSRSRSERGGSVKAEVAVKDTVPFGLLTESPSRTMY